MAYVDLIKRLAEHPNGVAVDAFTDADIREADQAGLLKFDSVWAIDYISLSDEGRRFAGLPPREVGPVIRFFEDFQRGADGLAEGMWRGPRGLWRRIADGLARR